MLNGVEHIFTYLVREDCIEVTVLPRDFEMLNKIGLGTQEPGLPPLKPSPWCRDKARDA